MGAKYAKIHSRRQEISLPSHIHTYMYVICLTHTTTYASVAVHQPVRLSEDTCSADNRHSLLSLHKTTRSSERHLQPRRHQQLAERNRKFKLNLSHAKSKKRIKQTKLKYLDPSLTCFSSSVMRYCGKCCQFWQLSSSKYAASP